jgi:hypothetical protein
MYRLSDEDSDSSLTIYYKAYNNNKPEMNESSSESTERTQRIEAEVARLEEEARKRKQEKKNRQRTAKRQRPRYPDIKPIIKGYDSDSDDEDALPLHISPPEAYTPLPRTCAEFQASASAYSGHSHWDLCSPLEFYSWTKEWMWTEKFGPYLPEHFSTPTQPLFNCPQHVLLDTQHLLYENPLPPVTTQTIEVLHDTGASVSMLPAQFTFTWSNVRPCLHHISGCFKGGEQDNNEIGEFHALLTLDSGETTRAIIPEAILAPAATTNTYLLAHMPLLMDGHEYICSLDRPRLKFNDGGEYTMSVKRGHQVTKMLPVNADKETTHQILYLHKTEPYDPPTYINSVLFSAANRPDAKTPLAFHYHLRFGCASEIVLKQIQQHMCGMQRRDHGRHSNHSYLAALVLQER